MHSVFVHPKTQRVLHSLAEHTPHAVMLSGPNGIGLTTLARELSRRLDAVFLLIEPSEGSLDVKTIRTLYDLTKTYSQQRRCVVLKQADTMSHQAQNALLKLIEEPPRNTTFVLLSHDPQLLLATIRSRTQQLEALPITQEASRALLDEHEVKDATKRAQLLFMAEGLPALLHQLSTDDGLFDARVAIVRDARTFAQGTHHQALAVAQRYSQSREDALRLVLDAQKILTRSLNGAQADKALRRLKALSDTYDSLQQNGNVRLQLAAAMIY